MKDPTDHRLWTDELRRLHDSNFAFDWDGHVRALNEAFSSLARMSSVCRPQVFPPPGLWATLQPWSRDAGYSSCH